MVNYDSLREHIKQIDEIYSYSMPIWLIILITVLGTLMIGARVTVFCYCKYRNTLNNSKTSSKFWHKENPRGTTAMLSCSPQLSIGSPKTRQSLRS